jgi:hypothetical protein
LRATGIIHWALVATLLGSGVSRAAVEDRDHDRDEPRKTSLLALIGGAAIGLATHEAGHLTLDLALGADPYLKGVDFHGLPFFAITYRNEMSGRAHYSIAASGFWVQHALCEALLTQRPDLRRRAAPWRKGILAFHVATSVAYAGAAFARTGPLERDTYGMAHAQRVNERHIGALILAPALLDTYRYYRPRSRWASWSSRGLKAATILIVLRTPH